MAFVEDGALPEPKQFDMGNVGYYERGEPSVDAGWRSHIHSTGDSASEARPIPESHLRDILEAATRAPSGGNSQPWHFVVVRDGGLRAKFGPLYREAWWAKRSDAGILSPEVVPAEYRPAMRLADEIGEAPIIVLLCATAKGFGPMASVIPAAQNLLLAARALGIGGTITTLHPQVDERVHALFGIPETAQIVYCLPLGYPRGRFGPAKRKPISQVCSYDRWGNAFP